MRLWLYAVIALVVASCSGAPVYAQQVPARALEHLPTLRAVQSSIWAEAPIPSFLAAQVEQESCISLKHPKCWNPRVELKTSREYGFGLGQTTIAYKADGSVRFNKWAELRARYPSLRGWTWENRYDPAFQLTAMVEMDKALYRLYSDAPTTRDRLGFALAGYNGGEGGNRQDKLLCKNIVGCDSTRWFGNVELYSLKSKVAFKGYGQSPFKINRAYPRNVLDLRRPKYDRFF